MRDIKTGENDSPFSPSVDTAVDILQFLSRRKSQSSTLTEIYTGIQANRSTVHRILRTLVSRNMIVFNPETKKYSLGSYLIVLGSRAFEYSTYLVEVHRHLEALNRESGWTAALVHWVTEGEVIYLDKAENAGRLRVSVSIGQRFSITDGAFGMALVSALSDGEVLTLARKYPGRRRLKQSDLERFLKDVHQARVEGIAVSNGMSVPGVCTIAGVIYDQSSRPRWSITILGFSTEILSHDLERLKTIVKEHCRELSALFSSRNPIKSDLSVE